MVIAGLVPLTDMDAAPRAHALLAFLAAASVEMVVDLYPRRSGRGAHVAAKMPFIWLHRADVLTAAVAALRDISAIFDGANCSPLAKTGLRPPVRQKYFHRRAFSTDLTKQTDLGASLVFAKFFRRERILVLLRDSFRREPVGRRGVSVVRAA